MVDLEYIRIIIKLMKKETAFGNKLVRKKDYDRSMQYHLQSIRNVKPVTRATEYGDFSLNNRKKQFQNQEKFTQIERQNRILLDKITSIMNKTKRGFFNDRANKSLNSTFRKKQMQNIEVENARFLKRLQQKKPNYETQKFNKDWQKQKNAMKIMSNFHFMLSDRPRQRGVSMTQMEKKTYLDQQIEMVRVRVINGFSFLITINLNSKKLRIMGDCKDRKQIKVIQIQRGEALQFIQQECQGKLQLIFEHLRFDKQEGVLYLIGNEVDLEELIAKDSKFKNRNISQQNEEQQYEQQMVANQIKYSKQGDSKEKQTHELNV